MNETSASMIVFWFLLVLFIGIMGYVICRASMLRDAEWKEKDDHQKMVEPGED